MDMCFDKIFFFRTVCLLEDHNVILREEIPYRSLNVFDM